MKTHYIRKYALVIIFAFCACFSYAQVSIIQAQPTVAGYGYNELSRTIIINSSAATIPACYAIIECTSNGNKVFALRISAMDLAPGSNMISYNQLLSAEQLAVSPAYYSLQQTGRLPAGNYNCCVSIYRLGNSAVLAQQCNTVEVAPASAIVLLSPFDKQVLHTFFPSFFWNFSELPPDNIVSYSIKVAELKAGQTYTDAVAYNVPLVLEQGLMQTSYLYPASALSLEESKKYVWQVEAAVKEGKKYLSEIWMFQYRKDKKEEKVKKEEVQAPYASLTKTLSSVNYSFSDKINFVYNNETRDTVLDYKVYAQGSTVPVALSSDAVKIKQGNNRITFEVPRSMLPQKNKSDTYILEVRNTRNESWKMKFFITEKVKSNE